MAARSPLRDVHLHDCAGTRRIQGEPAQRTRRHQVEKVVPSGRIIREQVGFAPSHWLPRRTYLTTPEATEPQSTNERFVSIRNVEAVV